MAHFFAEYGLFLLKTVTSVVAILTCVIVILSAATRSKRQESKGTLQIESMNEAYDELKQMLDEQILDKDVFKKLKKQQKNLEKEKLKQKKLAVQKQVDSLDHAQEIKKRLFVLDFNGDMKASRNAALAKEITAVLSVATDRDEILVRLESPGGMVHAYGLAASQLERIVKKGISLTVAVDKIAASGGYMMACIAHRIIAAPFAIIGSIGVVAQVPNIHKLLKKHDVDVDILTAGEYKRTLTMLGENTEKGRQKFLQELEETHILFKAFVAQRRSQVDVSQVATGEHWYATQAKALHLVDEIMTSDEYLMDQMPTVDVYSVRYEPHKTLKDRLVTGVNQAVERLLGITFY